MRYPWVNSILLLLILSQLATGFLGFINGFESRAWILWMHGVGGSAILVILGWKGQSIVAAYRRDQTINLRRAGFLALMFVLIAILVTGYLWTFSGPHYLGGFSLVTLHIFLAVGLFALFAWHIWYMRYVLREPGSADRAAFLRLAGVSMSGVLLWLFSNVGRQSLALPGGKRRFTGSYDQGSFTGIFPQTVWIADRPVPINAQSWSLTLKGAIKHPLMLDYENFLQLVDARMTAILDCTGGWYSTQIWQGVRLERLLQLSELQDGASSVTVESVTGYQRRFSIAEARGYLLATKVGDRPLSHGHGFPVRLVAPGKRGYEWVKWITNIKINETGSWIQSPLPLQ
jgi:hypothetical protein